MIETWKDILQSVAWRHGVSIDDLRGPRIARKYSRARQEAYAALYETGRYSLPRIGKWLGDRHHTSVLAGIRRYREAHLSTGTVTISGLPGDGGSNGARTIGQSRL